MAISLGQALAWRLDRHHLVTGARSVADVVHRLGAVPAWSGDPDLAIRRRLAHPEPDAVPRALHDGDLIRTYAFRGATHLLTAEDAGVYMAVRAASRQWELRSWQDHYRLSAQDWPALREAVRDAVADGPVSHAELVDRVAATPRFRHLRPGLADRSHTLLKPFAWQGDLCLGKVQDGQPTFQSPAASPRWTGLPELDDAGRRAILAYLAAYGPATRANLHHWLVLGLSAGRRRVEHWLAELLDDSVVQIDVDDRPMLLLRTHLDALITAEPEPTRVTLLPGHDQWVLGPGTDDQHLVPAARRALMTRGANLTLQAGVVAGTWKIDRAGLAISWFAEAGNPPRDTIRHETDRLAGLLDRDLDTTVTIC